MAGDQAPQGLQSLEKHICRISPFAHCRFGSQLSQLWAAGEGGTWGLCSPGEQDTTGPAAAEITTVCGCFAVSTKVKESVEAPGKAESMLSALGLEVSLQ